MQKSLYISLYLVQSASKTFFRTDKPDVLVFLAYSGLLGLKPNAELLIKSQLLYQLSYAPIINNYAEYKPPLKYLQQLFFKNFLFLARKTQTETTVTV